MLSKELAARFDALLESLSRQLIQSLLACQPEHAMHAPAQEPFSPAP
jgi:hypothetical protein